MKLKALSWALTGALALAVPLTPTHAMDESQEAIYAAIYAAEDGRQHMLETFGKSTLRNGQFLWKQGRENAEITRVVISLPDQMAYAYRDRELIAVSTISSGTRTNPTPIGIFPILEKKRMHHSRTYDDAPMPYMQRLDTYGIAMHAGHLPGRPASHGCIRLPTQFAAKLFEATRVGTQVMIGTARPAPAPRRPPIAYAD
jgi:lipoprotein-anchoring transpeptidase ErfK/SrfK